MAGRKPRRKPTRRPQIKNVSSRAEVPDETPDAFAVAQDKVSLELEEAKDDSELSDEQEEAVLDLQDESSDQEFEEFEDEDSGNDLDEHEEDSDGIVGLEELEEDIRAGGQIGELAKQAKAAQLMLMKRKRVDESDGSESEEKDPILQWGKSDEYYGAAEGKEFDVDDEILDEEEVEVMKLQGQQARAMTEADYGIEALSSGEDQEVAAGANINIDRMPVDISSNTTKNLADLSHEAPELLALCTDLKSSLSEVRQRIGPLVQEARDGGLCENEGLSYLEVKHHLLLHYCICISFYMLLKLEGKPVKDHPVILRLIGIRSYLEKIRPIDARLKYQVDKLLRAAQMAKSTEDEVANDEDGTMFKPRPDALVGEGLENTETGDGLYKAPRLNPVAMEDEMDAAHEKRRMRDERKRAAQSDLMDEMVEELTGAPQEVHDRVPGWDTPKAIQALKKMENRSRVEEGMLTRIHLTKEEKKKLKAFKHRSGMSGGVVLTDFADDVKDTLGAMQGPPSSQHFGANTLPQKTKPKSGDADLPPSESYWERNRRIQELKAKKYQMSQVVSHEEEDEYKKQARQAKLERQAEKKAKRDAQRATQQQTKPPSAPPTVGGPRGISQDIQKNRGLTPNRRRDIKNPRKRQRLRYETAQKKRTGMVQKPRKTDDVYGGEPTGIKKNVSKSVHFS